MFKLKSKLLLMIFATINVLLFVSCEKDLSQEISPTNNKIENLSFLKKKLNNIDSEYDFIFENGNNKVRFTSSIKKENLFSSLSFFDGDKWKECSNLLIPNIKDINSKKEINKLIEKKANSIKTIYSYETLTKVKNLLQILPEKLFFKLEREDYYNEKNLAIFYHLAIFNSAIRAIDFSKNSCNCGLYSKSLNEKTPFFCSEDKLVDKESILVLLTEISKNISFKNKTFIPNQTILFINNSKKNIFQASDIDRVLRKEFNDFLNNKFSKEEKKEILNQAGFTTNNKILPLDPECILYGASTGGDCGCCGNYSGPCYYCHIACYLHDLACEDCGWGCGWACVPGPC
jgi:hypothetical protein